ncbi:hypothetical protein K227x_09110 [Rubripirellula lacrimiformis]|uniref:Uncharacterized protein n=2 Tax=Rubripirellula lacrimiformis TaxID=1930273 RepID=A0A517N5Y3_9BACT|nr:hypothetical protein K227x_09110 [Rubripirellula lacrimiformis]
MALVVIRGAINGELAGSVASEAIVAMIVFAGVGFVAGKISDYLIRDSLERMFRARVEWYREGVADSGLNKTDTPSN